MVHPLRPELYDRLERRLGPVLIAHPGEEMQAHIIKYCGRPRLQVTWPGEYYRVRCPYCNDTRHRLWINHRWALWIPAVRSDNLWLAHCYNEKCLAEPGRAKQLRDFVFNDFVRGQQLDPVLAGRRVGRAASDPKPAAPYIWPLQSLPPDHPARRYMHDRGYDPIELGMKWHVGYCEMAFPDFPMADNRIIVPIYFRGKLAGWQARYIGEPPDKQIPKYYGMPGMRKSELLYNFDVASQQPFVVVCEGVTSAWRFGPEAVALLGKHISDTQTKLLTTTWAENPVAILLDGDATKEAQKVYDALGNRVRHKLLVSLPVGNDPGDYDRDPLRAFVFEAAARQGLDLQGLAS